MVYYEHLVVDSRHSVAGVANNFIFKAPKFPSANQFCLRRFCMMNNIKNINKYRNTIRLLLTAKDGDDVLQTQTYAIKLPQQFYSGPSDLMTALNLTDNWFNDGTLTNASFSTAPFNNKPVFEYMTGTKQVRVKCTSCVSIAILSYPGQYALMNEVLGFKTDADSVVVNPAGVNTSLELYSSYVLNMMPTHYIVVVSNALSAQSQSKFKFSNDMFSNAIALVHPQPSSDYGERIVDNLNLMFNYMHHNSHLIDIKLLDDKGNPLEIPDNSSIILEFDFYNFNTPVAMGKPQ